MGKSGKATLPSGGTMEPPTILVIEDDAGIREIDARLADMAAALQEQTPPSVAYRVRDQQEQDKPRVGVTVPNDAPAHDER